MNTVDAHKKKYLSLSTAIIINMNAMIGAGIFSIPHALLLHAGPAGIITCLLTTLGIWCLAFSFADLATQYPGEGSFYHYAERWGGSLAGSFSSLFYMVGMMIAMGLLTQVTGNLIYELLPVGSPLIYSLLLVIALLLFHVQGVTLSSHGQQLLIAATLIPMSIIIILCLTHASFDNLLPFAPYGFLPIITATKIVIFGFFGFECTASLTPFLHNAKQNLPRAITRSVVLVGALYLLFTAAIILALPPSIHHHETSLPQLLAQALPQARGLLSLVRLAIISALIGTLHAMLWAASNLLSSISRKLITQTKYTFNPAQSLCILCIGILLSCITISQLDLFFSLTALAVVIAYGLALITLLHPRSAPATLSTASKIRTWIGLAMLMIIAICALQSIMHS
jgi:APA family basic amino acid/polyamine antiporter